MNKKKKTYLLLIAVIGVWSLIGYNIFSYSNPKEVLSKKTIQQEFTFDAATKEMDTLVISNYRDPFLGSIKKNKKKIKAQNPTAISFPTVMYHGLVNGNKEKSCVISVRNQQEIVKVGHTFLDVKLISASAKEITVVYKRVQKTIKIQD